MSNFGMGGNFCPILGWVVIMSNFDIGVIYVQFWDVVVGGGGGGGDNFCPIVVWW